MTADGPQETWWRWNAICIDCAPGDLESVVAFYRDLLGLQVAVFETGWAKLVSHTAGMDINVQAEQWYEPPVWPEPGPERSKMMHFEINVGDVEAAVARAVSLGAREAQQQPSDRDQSKLRVLLDPAGHPFCLWT
ncbi:MAG TPA: VOC family protein [Actinomycetota bacterium]|nr:VOC family protein [Actinomycetota bacterium]